MLSKNITIFDIADQLNLSPMTVSKALRDHSDISITTAKLIKKKANELGYIPNYFAKNLASRKTNLVGLMLPQITDNFYSVFADEVFSKAQVNGLNVILMVSKRKVMEEEKIFSSFISMKVDGVILNYDHGLYENSVYRRIRASNIPIALYKKNEFSFIIKIDNLKSDSLDLDFYSFFPSMMTPEN